MQKLKFLKPALPLTIICVVIAFLLAFINAVTEDRIAQNALKEKEEAILKIFPDADSFVIFDKSYYTDCVNEAGAVKNKDGNVIGHYADVSPIGFKGEIALIVGLDLEGKVLRAFCLSTAETPAVGTRATEDTYLEKYASLTSAEAEKVDTITGATISSKAVRHGIYDAALTIEKVIEGGQSHVED